MTGYRVAHYHARKVIGSTCASCGTRTQVHAALRRDTPADRLVRDGYGVYSTDPARDYIALCSGCHAAYDNEPPAGMLSQPSAAARLAVSVGALRAYVHRGHLAKHGGHNRAWYPVDQVERLAARLSTGWRAW